MILFDFPSSFQDGKEEGVWEMYYSNGQLNFKGAYKNGKWEGVWKRYYSDGTVDIEYTGTFKNGVKVSD